MKLLYSFVAALILVGCSRDFDISERVVSQIKIVDSQGNPIEGALISMRGTSYDYSSDFDFHMNETESNANGDSFLVFPTVTQGKFNVRVSDSTKISGETIAEYELTKIIGIDPEQCANFRFPITEITLYKTAELTTLLMDVVSDSGGVIISAKLEGAFSGTINYNADFDFRQRPEYRVKKGQTITLHYFVNR